MPELARPREDATHSCRQDRQIIRLSAGEIHCADALAFLDSLPEEAADIVFIDPPFNLGKKYGPGVSDRLLESDYRAYISAILHASIRLLAKGGALYLYHLPRWALEFSPLLISNLTFRHWIAISMKSGFARGQRLYPAHYALLYFTKGVPKVFCRPKIEPPLCARCKRLLRDYGGYAKYMNGGVNLSDFWDDLSPVRHKKYKTRSSNELPPEIPRRALAISGIKGGLIVDPFAGSGNVVLEAAKMGLRYLACDSHYEYCQLIASRVKNLTEPDLSVTVCSCTERR